MDLTCRQILELLAQSFNSNAAQDWKATIQFHFDGEGDFYLDIGDGNCKLCEGVAPEVTATIKTAAQTWIDLSLGKINPMTAFMTGKVTVKGHMGDIMKLQNRNIFPVQRPTG